MISWWEAHGSAIAHTGSLVPQAGTADLRLCGVSVLCSPLLSLTARQMAPKSGVDKQLDFISTPAPTRDADFGDPM